MMEKHFKSKKQACDIFSSVRNDKNTSSGDVYDLNFDDEEEISPPIKIFPNKNANGFFDSPRYPPVLPAAPIRKIATAKRKLSDGAYSFSQGKKPVYAPRSPDTERSLERNSISKIFGKFPTPINLKPVLKTYAPSKIRPDGNLKRKFREQSSNGEHVEISKGRQDDTASCSGVCSDVSTTVLMGSGNSICLPRKKLKLSETLKKKKHVSSQHSEATENKTPLQCVAKMEVSDLTTTPQFERNSMKPSEKNGENVVPTPPVGSRRTIEDYVTPDRPLQILQFSRRSNTPQSKEPPDGAKSLRSTDRRTASSTSKSCTSQPAVWTRGRLRAHATSKTLESQTKTIATEFPDSSELPKISHQYSAGNEEKTPGDDSPWIKSANFSPPSDLNESESPPEEEASMLDQFLLDLYDEGSEPSGSGKSGEGSPASPTDWSTLLTGQITEMAIED